MRLVLVEAMHISETKCNFEEYMSGISASGGYAPVIPWYDRGTLTERPDGAFDVEMMDYVAATDIHALLANSQLYTNIESIHSTRVSSSSHKPLVRIN